MAGHGIFIGWGEIVPGRERQSRQVFGEVLALVAEEEQAGNIESHEVVGLQAHGGDLSGFILIRGDREKLEGVVASPGFRRYVYRAEAVVNHFGYLRAFLDDELLRQAESLWEAKADLE